MLMHSQDRITSAALLCTVIFHFIPNEHLASPLVMQIPRPCSWCLYEWIWGKTQQLPGEEGPRLYLEMC